MFLYDGLDVDENIMTSIRIAIQRVESLHEFYSYFLKHYQWLGFLSASHVSVSSFVCVSFSKKMTCNPQSRGYEHEHKHVLHVFEEDQVF